MLEGAALDVRVDELRVGPKPILHDVGFRCEPGTHTAILGPNGAGKTTLLRAIVGLLPFEGQVRVSGRDASTLSAVERARLLAYVPQRSLLQSTLSVTDVVWQGRFAHQRAFGSPRKADVAAVDHAMSLTDISALAERSFPTLSGGEQRRVLLARALATEAPIIALDEPTASLDVAHHLDFFSRLEELSRAGRTIVTVLHDLRDAERFCDGAIVLDAGQLVFQGAARLSGDLIREVFGVQLVALAEGRYERLRGEEGAS